MRSMTGEVVEMLFIREYYSHFALKDKIVMSILGLSPKQSYLACDCMGIRDLIKKWPYYL